MNTSEVYSQLIIENIIKKYLQRGEVPTLQQIEDEFTAIAATQDLSSTNFTSAEWKVERKEKSSSSKYNGMNNDIKQDLSVLYKVLLDNSDRAVRLFSRWQSKTNALESRLKGLEARVARLLLLTNDTSGFFSIVGDKFTDTNLIDLDRSSGISVNLTHNVITIDKNNSENSIPDRIFLNDLKSDQVTFDLITRNNVVSVTNSENTEPKFAFKDQEKFWKTSVSCNKRVSPLTAQLKLKLTEQITISKLDITLHSSQSNSATIVTPLVSTDGVNFARLPVINTAAQGLDKITFNFPDTDLTHLTILLEKENSDYIDNNLFVYEFGAKEIALYHEGFSTTGTVASFISKPLSITKPDKSLISFNKVAMEVCEGFTEETPINYYISVAQDSNGTPSWITVSGFSTSIEDLSGNDHRLWYPITPFNRTEVLHPKILDFASLSNNERTDIKVSYNKNGGDFISPANPYTVLTETSGSLTYSNQSAITQRYILDNTNQRILDTQIDLQTPVDLDSLVLWRNVGSKGISQSDTTKLVRGIQAGWEFEAPFYSTFIEIKGSAGITLDVGNHPMMIDNTNYTGIVGPDVLSAGIHKVRVHQDYWNPIEPDISDLASLKVADKLYPYNQKLLIEGYNYITIWPAGDEKVYRGVDRFAGIVPDKVSIFDLINNVSPDNYTKFSIDTDIESAVTSPSYLFVLNCDTTYSDFVNESFVLEFNLTNQLYNYVALKAELSTTSSKLTPVFDEYKIKLGF